VESQHGFWVRNKDGRHNSILTDRTFIGTIFGVRKGRIGIAYLGQHGDWSLNLARLDPSLGDQ